MQINLDDAQDIIERFCKDIYPTDKVARCELLITFSGNTSSQELVQYAYEQAWNDKE